MKETGKQRGSSWLFSIGLHAAAPAGTLLLLAAIFAAWDLFPLGNKTLSWCDMSQQVVPLLGQLQDIAGGAGSLFYSLQNAGGMNFWGVFLFFLSSPFSWTVVLVEKADLMLWMNVLVALKIALCAWTSFVGFRRWLPRLGPALQALLGVLYAFGGFALLFYQNLMWLDVMALFPLLLLAFGRLCRGQPGAFLLALSGMLVLNFYLSYMVVAFLVLGFALYVYGMVPREERKALAGRMAAACLISASLTAPVWLPALLQYGRSARGGDLLAGLAQSPWLTNLATTLPLLLCTGLFGAFWLFFPWQDRRAGDISVRRVRFCLVLFLWMAVPLVLEPVNKMWHGGSYQAFPARYGYMTTLLGLLCAGWVVQESAVSCPLGKGSQPSAVFGGVLGVLSAGGTGAWLLAFHGEQLTAYVTTLWGNGPSLLCLLLFFGVVACAYGGLLWMGRHAWLGRRLFTLLFCVLTAVQCLFQGSVYLGAAAREDTSYREVMDMSGKIHEETFTRVKTLRKDFPVNWVGALGYNHLGHYTSLTASDTLSAMKKLGYSSYWMEVSSVGGTLLSDALFSQRYTLSSREDAVPFSETVYETGSHKLSRNRESLPLGLRLQGDLEAWATLPEGSRFQVQQQLYTLLGGEGELFTFYSPSSQEGVALSAGEGSVSLRRTEDGTCRITYRIPVQEPQTLYFDGFGQVSTRLREAYNDAFTVQVNGTTVAESYPSQSHNGLLCLGAFQKEWVLVEVELHKNVSLRSFGVAGMDMAKLERVLQEAPAVEVQAAGDRFTTQVQAGEREWLYLSLPWDPGFTAKVNGREVPLCQVNDAFLALPLSPGTNNVELSFRPQGWEPGLGLLVLGAFLWGLYRWVCRRKKGEKLLSWWNQGALVCFTAGGILVAVLFYVFPLGVRLFFA